MPYRIKNCPKKLIKKVFVLNAHTNDISTLELLHLFSGILLKRPIPQTFELFFTSLNGNLESLEINDIHRTNSLY